MRIVFWLQNLKRRDHSEHLGIDGRIIWEQILRNYGGECVDWMHLHHGRDQWRAIVNMVMSFRFP